MSINKISSAFRSQFKITDSVTTDAGIRIPCITGQVGQVDVVSQNGYRYKTPFWDKVLGDSLVQDKINRKSILGTIEHPKDDDEFMSTSYENASHVIFKAWTQNHQPFSTFGLLNNPKGNAIKALVDVGVQPGVSTRGLGTFGLDDISQYVEDDNYCFLTWDIVKNPNFADLSMSAVTDSLTKNPLFKELIDMHQLRDSADIHYDKESLLKDGARCIAELQTIMRRLQQA